MTDVHRAQKAVVEPVGSQDGKLDDGGKHGLRGRFVRRFLLSHPINKWSQNKQALKSQSLRVFAMISHTLLQLLRRIVSQHHVYQLVVPRVERNIHSRLPERVLLQRNHAPSIRTSRTSMSANADSRSFTTSFCCNNTARSTHEQRKRNTYATACCQRRSSASGIRSELKTVCNHYNQQHAQYQTYFHSSTRCAEPSFRIHPENRR